MRRVITIFSTIFFSTLLSFELIAQDPCATAVKLTNVMNYCSSQKQYTNVGVTSSSFSAAACWSDKSATQDIWFKFTAVGTDVTITVKTNGANGSIKIPNIALSSKCTPTLIDEIACTNGKTDDLTVLYKPFLIPGNEYYIRIASTAANAGTFTLCIDNNVAPPNPQGDCDKAVKLCDKNPVHLVELRGYGDTNNETVKDSSCFETSGESNNCWYYWVCGTSGTLTFDLLPNDGVSDIDFILYSINNGSDVCSPRKVERCSATSCPNPAGATGLNLTDTDVSEAMYCDTTSGSIPSTQNGYVKYLDMVAGTTYALLINNSDAKAGFTLSFGGSGSFQGPQAKIIADKMAICAGESINYTSASTGTILNWNFSSGSGNPSSGTGTGPYSVEYAIPGNFTAILNATTGACTSTDYVNITVNEVPIVTVDSKEICEGTQATLTATPSIPGGTYTWNPGSVNGPTMTANPTSDQTYTVTYKLNGCEATGMGSITVNKKPEVTVNSEDICVGTTATLTASLKETTGNYTYLWSTGEQTKSITVSPTVKTTYTVTVKSVQGCEGIATGTVDVNGKLSVHTGADTTICNGATVNLKVIPNGTGYTYKWTPSVGTVSDPAVYNPTAAPTVTTTYTVDVTSSNGCKGSGMITVFIDPLMIPSLTSTNPTCIATCDGTVSVSITGGTAPYLYSWSGNCDKATCTGLCAGSYTVTVTDKIGCKITGNTNITEPAAIALQTSAISSICGKPNGSATVIASGGTTPYSYEWNDPAQQKTATANGLLSNNYCITVTDGKGCKKTACINVADKPGFTASLLSAVPVSCNGFCDGSAEVTVSGGVAPFTYSWSTSPPQTNAKAINLCAGNYVATINDGAGCVDTVQVRIVQPQPVTLRPVPPVTICIGSNATLNAAPQGGIGNYTYNWLPESTEITSTINVFPSVNTDYHVTVKDGNGCSSPSLVIKVNVNPPLKVKGSTNVNLCINDSAKLSAKGSGGNGGPYTYTWAPAIALTGSHITVKPVVSTTYTVTIKDNCGTPAATDTIRVSLDASPVIKFSADVFQGCNPVTVNFNDSTTVKGGVINSWKWDFGDKSASDSKNPTHVFTSIGNNPGIYSITLTVKSSNGCTSSLTKKNWIKVFPIPFAEFVAPVSNSILNPTVHFTNTSIGGTAWSWEFNDSLALPGTDTSSMYSPSHTFSEIGRYCVKLIVRNNGGCTSEANHCIYIDPQFVLYIPNAFTPNDDGDNDLFYAKGEYINDFEMRVFDRWGNMIYYADAISKPWNGKKNNIGEIMRQDIYIYQITIRDNKEKRHKYVGTITLVSGE